MTVVVPTHNRAPILSQSIDSILAQKDVSVTLVVVDDASSDCTSAVLAQYPSVAVVRHTTPTQQRIARNDGARLARTPWLAFCDDDDLWAPMKLRRQLDAANAQGTTWCTSSAVFVDEKLEPIGGLRLRAAVDVPQLIKRWNLVPGGGSGVLMRTALFNELGGFRDGAKYVEDWDLWIRLSQRGIPACVDDLLVAQRLWARSFSQVDHGKQYQAFVGIMKLYSEASQDDWPRPAHLGYFEVAQRLRTESRVSVLRDIPRILRRSPEDFSSVVAMLTLSDATLRWLRLRKLGTEDVRRTGEWLEHYRTSLQEC